MNIAVIAAGGHSGQMVVRELLAAGHGVRAGVHRRNPFGVTAGLTVLPTEATDGDAVAALILGTDVVVSAIGHVRGSDAHVQADATRVLIGAMKVQGLTRLVTLTGSGVRQGGDRITLMDRFLNAGIATVDPQRISDGLESARILTASDLDYTLLRVLKLTNRPAHPFVLTEHGPVQTFTSRQTVAIAVREVLENGTFVRRSPLFSNQT